MGDRPLSHTLLPHLSLLSDDFLDTPDDLDINVDDIETPDETDSLEFLGNGNELVWEGNGHAL